jgi:hypothetical protein
MKYQFIEQHKQDFPVVVMCHMKIAPGPGFLHAQGVIASSRLLRLWEDTI